MTNDLQQHYEAVLGAERAEKDRIRGEISSLNQQLKQKEAFIAALTAAISSLESVARASTKPLPFSQPIGLGAPAMVVIPDNQVFAGISVRWAILHMMSEKVAHGEVLGTADMAELLTAGGVRSGGVNFVANVSAVVSDMVKNRAELEPTVDGKYRITQKGRETWQTIRTSRRYRFRRYGQPLPE